MVRDVLDSAGAMTEQANQDRLCSKISVEDSGCWLWMGAVGTGGYGWFGVRYAPHLWRMRAAHRMSYMAFKGPIPEGLHLDHLCRVRLCVNPEHLEPVTQAENNRRAVHPEKTHCKNGHPLAGENLAYSGGQRVCRTCRRARALAYYHRQQEKKRGVA